METKIRKKQIKTEEFIIPTTDNANLSWASNDLGASQAAIAAKISSMIDAVVGPMIYKGAWPAPTNGIGVKKGWTYVYNGSGTVPTGVTLENGDMLIANQDVANPATASHWTIVQTNITGAITSANLASHVVAGGNITITNNNGVLTINATHPTISGGAAETGKYVSSISIHNGVITVAKTTLPEADVQLAKIHTGITPTSYNNSATKYNIGCYATAIAVYLNGVRLKENPSGQSTGDYSVGTDTSPEAVTEHVSTITFNVAPDAVDTILVDCIEIEYRG